MYFDEVIRLHYEHGYGAERISRILPISDCTASRWIAIFAVENERESVQMSKSKAKLQTQPAPGGSRVDDLKALQVEVSRLQSQLKHEKLRADAYDETINVAESMFKIPIRKKAGAKR
ncbi:MAG: transposase [Tannerellaceae bacterium]|nr:transposase [Tannerellaceae bacterium]